MAKVNISLNIGNKSFTKSKSYNQMFETSQEVDNSDGFINLLSVSSTKGTATLPSIKCMCIHNKTDVPAEVQLKLQEWKDNSNVDEKNSVDLGGGATPDRYKTYILNRDDFIYFANGRIVGYNADASAANATAIDNVTPAAAMYVDSTADLDHATSATMGSDATHTTLNLENGHSKFFKVGDLIRIENEICEVTAVGTGADLANSTCTIKRGLFGSTAATHADDVAIRLPFFNMTADFDKFSVPQTDKDGVFHAKNFFGYGRTGDAIADGIQSGSVAIKFYEAGYQEIGLSGITANTNSGLVTSTTYAFDIAVDGGSDYTLSFTTDSSNVNFGGQNGIIAKIKNALDAAYYASGNLFEKRVNVSIISGDIRFTSGQHLATSAISITAPASGTTPFGVGRLPAVADIEAAVAAKLPDDVLYDRTTYNSIPNRAAFMYDDGEGLLIGAGSGQINYETGEIHFNAFPNAQFVVSAVYNSAHSGGVDSDTTNGKNTVQSVAARSLNSKLNATVEIVAYN